MRKKTEILAIRDQDIEKYVGEYDDDEGTIDDSLQEPAYTVTGSLALVPIYGILGMDISCDTIQATLRQLKQDPSITSVLLDISSCGGSVQGIEETADLIQSLRDMGKRVYAYSDTYICSGAYWLGCTADKLYVSKSAITVNVGVYSVIIDTSKMYESMGVTVSVIKNKAGTYKAAGVDGTSLTQEQVAFEQAQVDYIADKFRGWVKAHRPQAKEQDLQGQDYYGAQAVELGLADKVSSYDEAVSEILGGF